MPRVNFRPVIRFARYGCKNRPFFHLVVADPRGPPTGIGPIFEKLGSFDPLPNKNNEKLIGFDFDRIQHWLVKGAYVSGNAKDLLGLAGFLPLSPQSLQHARRKQVVSELRDRVASGETLSDEDIPITVRYQKNHPIYERIYQGDGHDRDTSKINLNDFENNYHYHSVWSDRFRELNKEWYKSKED